MANSVVKLTIDSQEYDAKLKSAGKALNEYFDIVKKGDRTFEVLDDGVLDAVKALGQMETANKSAKGSLSELQKAFTDMSLVYRRFTDEEKASPAGKAMAQSLSELKTRINDTKKELADINKEINGGGGLTGALDSLAGKFGMNIQQLAGWGAAIGAAKVALDTVKDAFFASEANVDEWGRTMAAGESLYQGFLTALNTGDISGFLSRIDDIVNAARKAYDELDRLGTMKTIQSPKFSAQQAENERLRGMIQTGRYIAPLVGNNQSVFSWTKNPVGLKEGQMLTPEQIKGFEQQLRKGTEKIVDLMTNEITQTSNAIEAVYKSQATELGMSLQDFKKGTSSMAEFDKRMQGYSQYEKWRRENYDTDSWGYSRPKMGNPYQQYKNWGVFRVDGERYNNLVKLIQQRDQQAGQAYGMQTQAFRTINRAEGITLRKIMGGSGPDGKQLTDQEKAQAKYEQAEKDYNQALEQAALEVKAGTADTVAAKKKELSATETLWNSIGDAREIYDSEELKTAQEDAAQKVVELGGSVTKLVEEQKKAQEAARELATAQKKAAEAYRNMQVAQANNDLKAYNTALKQYQTAQADVTRLGGELPKLEDRKVVYTVEVNAEQLANLKSLPTEDETIKINVEEGEVNLPLVPKDDQTIRFNVEQGKVDLPDIPKDDQTIRFNVEQGNVDLPEVPKTYTVTIEAATQEAAATVDNFVQDMDAKKVEIPVNVEQPKLVEVPVTMSYTDNNMSAFLASLKERIAQEDVGSILYQNLTKQLADANALANLMQTAIKNGIDISQFNPQDLWSKVFGQNPGDYIRDEQLEEIRKKIEETIGKPIKLDLNSGQVNVENKQDKITQESRADFNKITGSLSTITGALHQLGVEVPEGFSKTLGVLQVISTITMAIQALATVTATTSALKSIPIVGMFLQNGGVVHAANGWAGTVPGNSFSGDNVPALLNSGEVVLTRAMASNLASQLSSNNAGATGRAMATIESDQIKIVLQNGAQSRGMTLSQYLEL